MKNNNSSPKKDEVAFRYNVKIVSSATLEGGMDFLECPDPRIFGILINGEIENDEEIINILLNFVDK